MAGLSRTWVAPLSVFAASLVFAIVLGLTLACQPSETDRLEERWALLGVPEVEFVFLGDLTSDERESIRRELKAAQVNFAEHFGAVTSDFRVYLSTDRALLNERVTLEQLEVGPLLYTCGGDASGQTILISLEDCFDSDRARGGPLAHLYFLVLQRKAGTPHGPAGSTRWMVEGSATYASAIHKEIQGHRSLTARREGARLRVSAYGTEALYDWGFLAVDRLVERPGPEAILEFFRLGSHRVAFRSAFDMNVDAFRNSFERHLSEVASPFEWRIAGTVLDSDGPPVEGMWLWAVVRIEGEAWVIGHDETDTSGVFEFIGPGSGYTIRVWLQCPRDDDVVQWVHGGEWGAAGLVADSDGIWEPGQEGAEPFTDGERDRTGLAITLPETRDSLVAKHCEP